MSYTITKRVRVTEDRVLITGASSNVYPKIHEEWEAPRLTKMLKEEGRHKVDIELLKLYEGGELQGGTNKYTRAFEVLKHMPEYPQFNWRVRGIGKEYDENSKRRKTEAFDKLLSKALKMKMPSERYALIRRGQLGGQDYWAKWRRGGRTLRWQSYIGKATTRAWRKDLEGIIEMFGLGDKAEIVRIK